MGLSLKGGTSPDPSPKFWPMTVTETWVPETYRGIGFAAVCDKREKYRGEEATGIRKTPFIRSIEIHSPDQEKDSDSR